MTLQITETYWFNLAPCSGLGDDFHPSKAEGPGSLRVRRAKRVCGECPFQRECLEEAYRKREQVAVVDSEEFGDARIELVLKDSSAEGIWGGTTPAERKAVAHLPISERIEVLLAWTASDVTGPFATRVRKEAV